MQSNRSFYGGVIYIDLRGYTKIVEEKILANIASIIYDYQSVITNNVARLFEEKEIAVIEYMGDGLLIIIKDNNVHEVTENNSFAINLYNKTKILKTLLIDLLYLKKQEYTGLKDLDFGIGISTSMIYQKNITSDDKNNNKTRKMFFGTSLNRAAKIGDSMSKKKKYIGIDKRMYDEFLLNNLEQYTMKKDKNPIVHMHLV